MTRVAHTGHIFGMLINCVPCRVPELKRYCTVLLLQPVLYDCSGQRNRPRFWTQICADTGERQMLVVPIYSMYSGLYSHHCHQSTPLEPRLAGCGSENSLFRCGRRDRGHPVGEYIITLVRSCYRSTTPTFFCITFAHTKRVWVGTGLDIEQYRCRSLYVCKLYNLRMPTSQIYTYPTCIYYNSTANNLS